jgi:hypothetical protein
MLITHLLKEEYKFKTSEKEVLTEIFYAEEEERN